MLLFNKLIDRRLAVYQRELIEIHYAEVENMYRQIRGWRHDYRSHIQVMKALAAEEDWDALRGYLDELETDLSTVDTVVKTGNPMADAILNSKISTSRWPWPCPNWTYASSWGTCSTTPSRRLWPCRRRSG